MGIFCLFLSFLGQKCKTYNKKTAMKMVKEISIVWKMGEILSVCELKLSVDIVVCLNDS